MVGLVGLNTSNKRHPQQSSISTANLLLVLTVNYEQAPVYLFFVGDKDIQAKVLLLAQQGTYAIENNDGDLDNFAKDLILCEIVNSTDHIETTGQIHRVHANDELADLTILFADITSQQSFDF